MTGTLPFAGTALDWLLEPDQPAVRYLALRDLLDVPEAELADLRRAAHQRPPIAEILDHMDPQGFWELANAGYSPKYRSAVWSMLSLAQTGASIADARVQTACSYMLEHSLAPGGQFTYSGKPSGTFDCLQGNLSWALTELGCQDERLDRAFEWMARTVTGEGMASAQERSAPYRYSSYKCGPNFACAANSRLPCAWGAVKVVRAFGNLPREKWTPMIQAAIQMGIDFLLSVDPTNADYPHGDDQRVSSNWWKFGFPLFYITDLLQLVEALVSVGVRDDPRLQPAIQLIQSKQDPQGRWKLEYSYASKAWGQFGRLNQPNKWVTLRALRVLKRVGSLETTLAG